MIDDEHRDRRDDDVAAELRDAPLERRLRLARAASASAAMWPISVASPVATTTARARPAVTCVPA